MAYFANHRPSYDHYQSVPNQVDDARTAHFLRFIARKAQARSYSLRYVFRSFDEDHNGMIDKHEFGKALRYIGLDFNNAELDMIFGKFDRDGGGAISYDEFARTVTQVDDSPYHIHDRTLALDEADERALQQRYGMHLVPKSDVIWLLAQKVELKNSKHMVGKAFRQFDEDGSGTVSLGEFDRALQHLGFDLSNDQLQELFSRFDRDGSGEVDHREFSRALFPDQAPPLKPKGQQEIAQDQQYQAYLLPKSDILAQLAQKATVKGKNYISLISTFRRCDRDMDGYLTYPEVRSALLEAITFQATERDLEPLFQRCDSQKTGLVDYTALATLIDPSHLNRVPVAISDASSRTLSQIDSNKSHFSLDYLPKTDILRLLADKVLTKKSHQNVRTLFRSFDSDRDGKISYREFDAALRHIGMDLAEEDFMNLIRRIDTSNIGYIDFDELASKLERVDGGTGPSQGGTFGSPPKNFGPPSQQWGQTVRPGTGSARHTGAPYGTNEDMYSTPHNPRLF